jgi:hypothetical protein
MPTDTADDIRRAIVAEAPYATAKVGEYLDGTEEITVTWLPGFKGKIGTTHSGKRFVVLDPNGGFRVYQRGDRMIVWWFGYYLAQPIDHFCGLRASPRSSTPQPPPPAVTRSSPAPTGATRTRTAS